jgi:hypothetical protein
MKLVLEIKTEPVTQASIIVAVVAFSSGSVALIVIYSQSSLVCVCCVIALAIIVYTALRFSFSTSLTPDIQCRPTLLKMSALCRDPPPPRRDERAAPGFLPPRRDNVPLVLQVSPLDAESSGVDEFFYDPFADLEIGDFAAAQAFFVRHGHVVVFQEWPDTMAFQAMFPKGWDSWFPVREQGSAFSRPWVQNACYPHAALSP